MVLATEHGEPSMFGVSDGCDGMARYEYVLRTCGRWLVPMPMPLRGVHGSSLRCAVFLLTDSSARAYRPHSYKITDLTAIHLCDRINSVTGGVAVPS
jgi:hypothetical protein